MTKEVHGSRLGVEGCEFTARGSTEEIVSEFIEHLRAEHEIDMPDVDAILEDQVGEGDVAEGAWMLMRRLQTTLDIIKPGAEKPWPPVE